MHCTPSFASWRLPEIITLVPIIGMLGCIVHGYEHYNTPTPASVLTLFVVSVLALIWALATFMVYGFIERNALLTACIDFCFVVTFIAGVCELSDIALTDCTLFQQVVVTSSFTFRPLGYGDNIEKSCNMVKASFALGIVNTIFFGFTCVCIGTLPPF